MAGCDDPLNGGATPVDPGIGSMSYRKFGNYFVLGCAGLAIIITIVHIFLHAITYSRPAEQRHIIRILAMVPIYAFISALSYNFPRHAISFEIVRDCYEAICIASFFALMCHYIRPTLHEQKDFFRRIEPKPWLWPMSWLRKCTGGEKRGCLRTPRNGLTWFNIIWIGIFQYVFFRPAMTILAVICQAFDRYCESSLNPKYGHIWVICIEALAVTIAMYCLIQFYYEVRPEIKRYKPLMKVLAIKLVIFFSFWQAFVISILSAGNFLKPSNKFSYSDIKIGLPSFLICVEMSIFAVLHLFAYSWLPYRVPRGSLSAPHRGKSKRYYGSFLGLYAIAHALNPWDLIKGLARGTKWLFCGVRNRERDAKIGMEPMKADILYPGNESIAGDGATDDNGSLASYGKPHMAGKVSPANAVGGGLSQGYSAREDEVPLTSKLGTQSMGYSSGKNSYDTGRTYDVPSSLGYPPSQNQQQYNSPNQMPAPYATAHDTSYHSPSLAAADMPTLPPPNFSSPRPHTPPDSFYGRTMAANAPPPGPRRSPLRNAGSSAVQPDAAAYAPPQPQIQQHPAYRHDPGFPLPAQPQPQQRYGYPSQGAHSRPQQQQQQFTPELRGGNTGVPSGIGQMPTILRAGDGRFVPNPQR